MTIELFALIFNLCLEMDMRREACWNYLYLSETPQQGISELKEMYEEPFDADLSY